MRRRPDLWMKQSSGSLFIVEGRRPRPDIHWVGAFGLESYMPDSRIPAIDLPCRDADHNGETPKHIHLEPIMFLACFLCGRNIRRVHTANGPAISPQFCVGCRKPENSKSQRRCGNPYHQEPRCSRRGRAIAMKSSASTRRGGKAETSNCDAHEECSHRFHRTLIGPPCHG